MYFAIGFIFTFIHGGLTGLFLGNVVIDLPLSDTYFVVAHFHLVMGVSPILVLFAALYHWYPKISGRMYNETMAKVHFGLLSWRLRNLSSDALPRILGSAQKILCARQYGLHPTVCSRSEFLDHDCCADCGGFSDTVLYKHHRQPEVGQKQTPTHGAPPLWNGKRLIHRQCTATGVIAFLLCTDGPMTTASRSHGRLYPAEHARRRSGNLARCDVTSR